MNKVTNNSGVVTFGGTTNVTGSAVGDGASVNIGRPASQHAGAASGPRGTWDIGIVTILAKEMKAVREVFELKEDEEKRPGEQQRFYTGTVESPGGVINVVAVRALSAGQRPMMATLGKLRSIYDPTVLVLVGIGGAIHRDVAIDDVVVATRVVYYDLRKVTPKGVLHRGEERESPAAMVHAVNSFFTDHGEPAELRAQSTRPIRVFFGPIGSGDAVIADAEHEIRKYLASYNDKILAVDMEAGGLSQFCYETPSASGRIPGWVVIRGISDNAGPSKDDNQHDSAAINAAHTLHYMIPYIHTELST
jgi:adenosylhomocysteine nucleosidase